MKLTLLPLGAFCESVTERARLVVKGCDARLVVSPSDACMATDATDLSLSSAVAMLVQQGLRTYKRIGACCGLHTPVRMQCCDAVAL